MALTRQEMYERVREHFTREGAVYGYEEAAEDDDGEIEEGRCVYRGNYDPASPMRCALGVLIPDDLYSPSMEGTIASSAILNNAELYDVVALDDGEFADAMQNLHDGFAQSNSAIPEFVAALDAFATGRGLAVVAS